MFLKIPSPLITLDPGARGRHYVRGKALGHLSLQYPHCHLLFCLEFAADTGRLRKRDLSTRNLPFQPSLRHLKQEAKQFHKALQDGDSAIMDRVREGLPRLSADATVDDVTLMEAQQVLAREYGFREWPPSPKGQ